MKRIIVAAFLAALAVEAGAQNWMDALDYAGNDYLGSARSVGMGNAMTAVGGDLGSLTFNPAGSAVAGYSQFTITPGLSVASVFGQGTLVDGTPYGFQNAVKTRSSRFQMPNFGAVVAYDTRRKSGLKRVTFGMVGNMTRNYNYRYVATGTNTETSLAGSFGSQADGYPVSVLEGSYDQYDAPSWETMTGYAAGIINPFADDRYYGLTERVLSGGKVALADEIGQLYRRERQGSKYDLLMNLGLNFSDRFYLGGNIGISMISMALEETRGEDALSGGSYPAGFQSLRSSTLIEDNGSGIYAKIGFLARPFDGLRIGAAIQTPTLFEFHEAYRVEARSSATGRDRKDMSASVDDEFYYNLRTPMRFNAGVAYTFGKVAILSADYELCDYSKTAFRTDVDTDPIDFSWENDKLQNFACASHSIRVGGELKPSPEMAIRVGYNYTTSPEIDTKASRQAVSFGLGYSSPGSFFADFAVRFQYLPDELITPYYYYDMEGNVDNTVLTPQIGFQTSVCNALVTLGWRF